MSAELKLSYSSPLSEPFSFTTPLPSHPSTTAPTATDTNTTEAAPSSIAEKKAYLSGLRAALTGLQAQTNAELTARMEEDKLRDAAAASASAPPSDAGTKGKGGKKGAKAKKSQVDEEAEEQFYGEEVVDEDD